MVPYADRRQSRRLEPQERPQRQKHLENRLPHRPEQINDFLEQKLQSFHHFRASHGHGRQDRTLTR